MIGLRMAPEFQPLFWLHPSAAAGVTAGFNVGARAWWRGRSLELTLQGLQTGKAVAEEAGEHGVEDFGPLYVGEMCAARQDHRLGAGNE